MWLLLEGRCPHLLDLPYLGARVVGAVVSVRRHGLLGVSRVDGDAGDLALLWWLGMHCLPVPLLPASLVLLVGLHRKLRLLHALSLAALGIDLCLQLPLLLVLAVLLEAPRAD